jgi:hypothetical protein
VPSFLLADHPEVAQTTPFFEEDDEPGISLAQTQDFGQACSN